MATPSVRLPTTSGSALTDTGHLWRRQLKRFANNPMRIAGMLMRPLVWLLLFGVAMETVVKPQGGVPYAQFALPGLIAMGVITAASRGGQSLLQDKSSGFLREVLVAPVSRTSIMLGFALGITTRSLVNALLMLGAGFLIGATLGATVPAFVANLLLVVLLLALMSIGLVSVTIAVAWLMDDPVAYATVSGWIFYPLFFLSGSLYKVKGLPVVMYWLVRMNPLAYGVDGIRLVMLGPDAGSFDLVTDFAFASGFAIVATAFGLWVMTRRASNA